MAKRATPATLSTAARFAHLDTWQNEVLNMGGTRDPSAYTTFEPRATLSDPTLSELYRQDPNAAWMVAAVVLETMAAGWDLSVVGDPAGAAKIRDAYRLREEAIGLPLALALGAMWGRLYGGAITWLGADDGRAPDLALDETKIEKFTWAHTYDRREVQVHRLYSDPRSPKFGTPEIFRVTPTASGGLAFAMLSESFGYAGGFYVHESRCIVWPGQDTEKQRKLDLGHWDDSVLERPYEALKQLGEDYGAKTTLLGKHSTTWIKIPKLYSMMAGKLGELLQTRLQLLDFKRTRGRITALGQDEELGQLNQPISGWDSLLDRGLIRVAGALRAPVAVMFGQNPSSGEGAKAEDVAAWVQTVEVWRGDKVPDAPGVVWASRHERAACLLMLSADGPTAGKEPEDWRISYRPLREPLPVDKANAEQTEAETLAIYIEKGVIPPESVALAKFTLTGTGKVVLDSAEVTAALKRRSEAANAPPKDNAELGTVGARDSAVQSLQEAFYRGAIPEEAAMARLELLFKFSPEDARRFLVKPAGWTPPPDPKATPPGPPPGPKQGEGAGAPQAPPGTPKAGGDPNDPAREKTTTGEPEGA